MRQIALWLTLFSILIAVRVSAQTAEVLPTDPGMYVVVTNGLTKIIGQIAEFKRSGSSLVSHATVGIKAQKENVQLLGPHAQNVVGSQPVFYFVPAKQEADAGVNAGDVILIRLEEKPERRQFEIATHGAWRSSSGISLTHQIQLYRSEVKSGIYKMAPATTLSLGEYALYLSRGEGMAAYVYDFSVQNTPSTAIATQSTGPLASEIPPSPKPVATPVSVVNIYPDASIGAFAGGDPDVRRDGVTLTMVVAGGSADQAGMKAGDVILAVNDRYLFTGAELSDEIRHHQPGSKITVRFRRHATTYEAALIVSLSR
jgi:hypothetical protein